MISQQDYDSIFEFEENVGLFRSYQIVYVVIVRGLNGASVFNVDFFSNLSAAPGPTGSDRDQSKADPYRVSKGLCRF